MAFLNWSIPRNELPYTYLRLFYSTLVVDGDVQIQGQSTFTVFLIFYCLFYIHPSQNLNDFFDFQPWHFFYHDFMTLWSAVLQIIIKKVQKNTQAFYFFFKVVCEKIFRNHKILGKIKAGRFRVQDLFCNFLSLTKSVCKVL